MAQNSANITPGQQAFVAGDGIEIIGNVIANTMPPPSSILDNAVTNPATITDFGGAYIVPATGATGAWAGKANQIATTSDGGATWVFTTPTAGMRRQVAGGANAGTVYRWDGTTWAPVVGGGQPAGTVLKTQCFNAAEVTASATTGFTATTLSASYTPVSTSSYLLIEVDASYNIGGASADAWQCRLVVAGALQRSKRQQWGVAGGGGTRGSTALPISGRYTNTTTAAKTIQAFLERVSGDDTGALNGTDRIIKVTEIQR